MTFLELNLLTASRSVLCPIVWFACWWKRPRGMVLWMVLDFAYFLVTDKLDGEWASAYGLRSRLGFWLDHLGDFAFYGVVVLSFIMGSREPDRARRRRTNAPGPAAADEPSPRPPS